jgi:hypothetical protein
VNPAVEEGLGGGGRGGEEVVGDWAVDASGGREGSKKEASVLAGER